MSNRTSLKLGPVDVVMCTWNSNTPCFGRCLRSIERELPVHHFILVDRSSNDGTVETVKSIFPNVIVKQTNANLGLARKLGIDLIDTEFFVFADSDIELCDGWFQAINDHLNTATGAIHGEKKCFYKPIRKWYDWLWKKWVPTSLKKQRTQTITTERPDAFRGATANTLLRTSVVRDWNPSRLLCSYEDHMLLRHVVKKGYVWKIKNDLIVKDWGQNSFRTFLKKAKWNMAGARLIGFGHLSLKLLLKALPTEMIKALYAALEMKEPMIIPLTALIQLEQLRGWVGWSKFLLLKR